MLSFKKVKTATMEKWKKNHSFKTVLKWHKYQVISRFCHSCVLDRLAPKHRIIKNLEYMTSMSWCIMWGRDKYVMRRYSMEQGSARLSKKTRSRQLLLSLGLDNPQNVQSRGVSVSTTWDIISLGESWSANHSKGEFRKVTEIKMSSKRQ